MNSEIEKQGYIWFLIRIVLTIAFIVIIDVMLIGLDPYVITLINLIIVSILDIMDSIPARIHIGSISDSKIYGLTKQYRVLDKSADILLYMIVVYIHIFMVNNIGTFEVVFISLFVYRALGTMLYIHTLNPIYMLLFPNLFVNCTIVYISFTHVWNVSNAWLTFLLILSVLFTFGYEYFHHMLYQKE